MVLLSSVWIYRVLPCLFHLFNANYIYLAIHSWGFLFACCWVDLDMINRISALRFFLSIAVPQKEYDIINLINQEGIYKQKINDDILNGIIYRILDNKKVVLGKLKNGEKDGLWTEWYPNKRKLEETYKHGILDGSVSLFYKTGQREWRHTYNNGCH